MNDKKFQQKKVEYTFDQRSMAWLTEPLCSSMCDVTYFHLEVSLEQAALLSLVRVGAAWTDISLSEILLSHIYFGNFS